MTMKIQCVQDNYDYIDFDHLNPGDVFGFGASVLMKTTTGVDNVCNAVNVETGSRVFIADCRVIKVSAELIYSFLGQKNG
jgi:hypothetical protein